MAKRQEKVLLSSIRSLAFFSEEYTKARRSSPIPQLTCNGKICGLYQPDAVQCVNIGGDGTDVNWKCEADLPSSLRFGKVTVSCEGWARPGDEYVLKGSCGLEYSLIRVPQSVDRLPKPPISNSRLRFGNIKSLSSDYSALLFYCILIYFGYLLFKSCVAAHRQATVQPRRGPGGGRGSNGGWSSWFGGGPSSGASAPRRDDPPPPYYSKYSPGQSSNPTQGGSWTPGFWTGVGAGGLATSLWNSRYRDDTTAPHHARERAEAPRQQEYDWEYHRGAPSSSRSGMSGSVPQSRYSTYTDPDDGNGLGETRRSTAVANSRVR